VTPEQLKKFIEFLGDDRGFLVTITRCADKDAALLKFYKTVKEDGKEDDYLAWDVEVPMVRDES